MKMRLQVLAPPLAAGGQNQRLYETLSDLGLILGLS
jgi:hypothetical protein